MKDENGSSPSQTWSSINKLIEERKPRKDLSLLLECMGDKAVVYFRGDPDSFEAVWDESNGWLRYDPSNALHKGIRPSLHIRLNVLVFDNEFVLSNRIAFWEMGVHTFKRLLKLRDDYGLDRWIYEIERLDNDDAEPHYAILPHRKIDDDQKVSFACLPYLALPTLDCRTLGIQHCSHCNDYSCGDNTSDRGVPPIASKPDPECDGRR